MRNYKSLIQPVKNRRTFEEVSNRIKELIFDGTFKPGERLPSESSLAELFSVGRQSVREALRVLERSGFISVKTGVKGGPVIEDTVHRRIAGLFLDAFRFNKVSLEDYTAALRTVEVSMIEFVFSHADESDLEGLADNIRTAREVLATGVAASDENIDFHRLLAKSSRNYIFSIVIEAVLAVLSDFRSKLAVSAGVELSREITDLHEEELKAIVARRKRRMAALIAKDLDITTQILMSKENPEQ
jgi:GntR family transcriptional regulator, transcriptional repressor for pyruvate dehydrogenase complex